MYFKLTLQKIVTVPPAKLGPLVNRHLEGYLRAAVEGKRLPDIGLVVAVLDIENPQLLEGRVLDNGNVTFHMTYIALVYKLFRGEVCDATVLSVVKDGFLASTGPWTVYVSKTQMPADYVYETDGSLAVFVLKDGTKSVRQGEVVRLRIMGETPKSETNVIFC